MSKTLVTFFSASGVTANKGQQIARKLGADTYEIKPAVPYTSADLNWQNSQSRSSVECKDPTCRPEIVDGTVDLSAYDTVYIGYPIWWYTAPNIINTFIEANLDGLKGKQIVLFKTSGGSGISKSVSDLQGKYPDLSFEAE
ncbi:MAG: flavodoxin [Clostridia bacterium]|nr:flavodoxin [Clostridia bacterium]